jgi:Do/DeqQ family serine protease
MLNPANAPTPIPALYSKENDLPPEAAISYANIVTQVAPAVVTVHSRQRVRAPQQFPYSDDPAFREFFGAPANPSSPQPDRLRSGLGSGVIVTNDGYILTNHHVVDGAEAIKVDLNDYRSFDARVIGSDPLSDLAVLKIEAADLPLLPLGNSSLVRVGDVVLAIGNPLGIGQTVTMGIISAKGRQTGLSDGSFEDFLQTDAPINQGNSGGALVSTRSELIGINSQILSPSGGSIGIGFAVPSNMARSVFDQLVRTGRVRRGQLGIVLEPDSLGIRVGQVQQGSPADRAGIKPGDIITAFNGNPVNDPNTLRNLVAESPPGSSVTITVRRGRQDEELKATLGELVPRPQSQQGR